MSQRIDAVRTAADVEAVRQLFREYAASLRLDLCFQNFDEEVAALPGPYSPPSGALLLARSQAEPAGCVAFHAWDAAAGIAEMKRLFVREPFRGLGLGRQLAERIIESARARGYRLLRLDSISDRMQPAIAMYRTLGFRPIEPYRFNPLPSASYWELDL